MRLKTRVLLIILSSLISLTAIGIYSLQTMRQNLYEERHTQIAHLLDFADALIKHYYAQETSGKLSREEAQARAIEAIGAQKTGNSYYFIRDLAKDVFVYHPSPDKLGKIDDGGRIPDGRTAAQAYRDELAASASNKAFLILPGQKSNNTQAKINGVLRFDPWGWMPGIGFYVNDIEDRFWNQALYFLVAGLALLLVVAGLAFRMRQTILRQLGGEPDVAANYMRKIASGNLAVEIPVAGGDSSSMMASLKLMQMKLTNITAAIHENTVTLSSLTKRFDEVSKSFSETRAEEDLTQLGKTAANIGKTAEILNRSITRFKL